MRLVDKAIEDYCVSKSDRPGGVCDELEAYTRANVSQSQMLIGKMEASVLQFLIGMNDALHVLEIGTYTGYSALAMAEVLPSEGRVITLDVDPVNGKTAHEYWEKSPHGRKIEQIIGPALETIPKLEIYFDLVFIDADKQNYKNYLDLSLEKLSDSGVIVLDNTVWDGKVLEENPEAESTRGIQEVNNYIASRDDLQKVLLPVRDGMFLVRKRGK